MLSLDTRSGLSQPLLLLLFLHFSLIPREVEEFLLRTPIRLSTFLTWHMRNKDEK